MTGPFFFIVNPAAGGSKTARLWPQLKEGLDHAKIEYQFRMTSGPQEAVELAAFTPMEWTTVVVGGDGTLSEVISGLAPGRVIGLIPTGRANDFARSAGISSSPKHALKQLLSGEAHFLDVPFVNKQPFLNVAGIGFNAEVASKAISTRGRGSLPYVTAFRTLARYRSPELSVELDGRSSTGRVFLLAVGNCRYFAGGMKICPGAHFDDGLLDVCIAGDLGKLEALLALGRIFRGTHVHQRKFDYAKAHTVKVDGPADVIVQADGQIVGRLPVTFTLKRRALRVILPKGTWNPSKVTSILGHAQENEDLKTMR